MKKRVLALLISLIMICGEFNNPTLANTNNNVEKYIDAEKQKIEAVRDELTEILKAELAWAGPTWEKASGEKVGGFGQLSSYDIDNAYMIRPIWSMNSAKKSGSLRESIEPYEFYDIPAVTRDGMSALVIVTNEDGKLRYHSMSYGGDTKDLYVDFEKINDGINKSSLVNDEITDLQLVNYGRHEIKFVFFSTKSEEFLMPFYFTEDLKQLNIEKYKVYSAKELIEVFCDDDIEEKNSDETHLYGGYSINTKQAAKKESESNIMWIVSLVIVLMIISVCYVYTKKRKMQIKQ